MGVTAEKDVPPAVEDAAPAVSDDPCEKPESDQPTKDKSIAGGCLSLIVLGASGDLAKKKTFPAIFNLYKQVQLSCTQMPSSIRRILCTLCT